MKIFVINLKKDKERRVSIESQLAKLNLKADFIDAVYGKDLSDSEISKYCPDFNKMGMTLGELGCAISHLSAYDNIIKNNINSALIIEDDAVLDCCLKSILAPLAVISSQDKKPLVILLNKTNEYIDSFKKEINSHHFLVNAIDGVLAVGYVINNPAAVNLTNFLTPIRFKSDEWRFFREKGVIKLKGIVPPVITPSGTDSSIGYRGYKLTELDEANQKRTIKEKITLTLWRIFVRTWLKKIKP